MNVQILDPKTGRPFMATDFRGAGGGFGGQLVKWNPQGKTINAALLPTLKRGNARADDLIRNNGLASGGVQLHVDNIVGHLFRLSAKPRWQSLGISEDDARAVAKDFEAIWLEIAEDPVHCWLDAERKRTFTMMVREAVRNHVGKGEVMSAAEWVEDRPTTAIKSAVKTITSHRVCNPNNARDTDEIRGGVRIDRNGAAVSYFVRSGSDVTYGLGDGMGSTWKEIQRETSWGRTQFMHVFEPTDDGQTRGSNKFLSIMEQVQMLSNLQNTKLQNALVSAMYAMTIETELGPEAAMDLLGSDPEDENSELARYLMQINAYHEGADIRANGVRIPHLLPGEKLNMMTAQNADNGFSDLESSLLRYMAAGLGVSYEQLARDYSKTNYSSARASIMESWRYFMGARKVIAARYASMIYSLVLEEVIQRGWVKLPRTATRNFYEGKAAWCNADWIGSGRIAIDGLKEVKEAILRIEGGLSTYEKEIAMMGEDYQEIFAQQVREKKEREEAGLPPPSWANAQALAPDAENEQPETNQAA